MAWWNRKSQSNQPDNHVSLNQQHNIRNATPAIERCIKKILKAESDMLKVRLQAVNEIRVELARIESCMKQEPPCD